MRSNDVLDPVNNSHCRLSKGMHNLAQVHLLGARYEIAPALSAPDLQERWKNQYRRIANTLRS